MKKYLFIAITIVIASFISCSKEDMPTQLETIATVSFNVQTPVSLLSRAAAPTVAGKDTRYIVEVWSEDKTTRIQRIVQLNNPGFTIILDKALSYNIAVWVDYVTDVDDTTPNPADYYYATSDFQRIVLNVVGGSPDAFDPRVYKMSNLPARDAFTGIFLFSAGQAYPTTLPVKRPLARVNIVAADASVWKNRPEINGDSISIRLTNQGYYTYNVLNQVSVATGINIEFTNTIYASTYNAYPSGASQVVLSGLYFAQTDAGTNLTNTKNFAIHWSVGEGDEEVIPLTNLPFQRNYNTNVSGGLIFNVANFNIDTQTEFETPDFNGNF